MTTVLKVADATDFLTAVPLLAGYRPVHSLVLVPFQGSRTLGVLRFDLPATSVDPAQAAATAIGMVCRIDHADGVALIVYTDEASDPDEVLPRTALVRGIRDRADACGIPVKEALYASTECWSSYLEPTPAVRALPDVLPDLAPQLAYPHHDQHTGATLLPVDLATRERTARALSALGDVLDTMAHSTDAARSAEAGPRWDEFDPRALAAALMLDETTALIEEALAWPDPPDPMQAAVIVWLLSRPALRDVALLQWCGGASAGRRALDAQRRWEEGSGYPPELAARFRGEGPRPDAARLRRALALVRTVASAAPRTERAGALAAAGWLSWALGQGTHASWYCAQAQDIDPDHGLAGIVSTLVDSGSLPDWAFEGPAA